MLTYDGCRVTRAAKKDVDQRRNRARNDARPIKTAVVMDAAAD
jgi:hypothetical protein